ncbi:MAG: ATP synthase F1 subunit delta [Elusimicrobiaceae bacterium]|nr:ATP synthase F1 subunit delta [Elusimicrobiaceae bacterium]
MNSSERIAAKRYAIAYDSLSTNVKDAQRRSNDLHIALQALTPMQGYMTSPCIPLAEKKKLILSSLVAMPDTATFLALLVDAKRYSLLPVIEQEVQLLTDKRRGIVRADVISARELSVQQKKETQEAIAARYHAQAEVNFSIDKTLLGGLKIVCQGEQIDGSLQGQLQRLFKDISK